MIRPWQPLRDLRPEQRRRLEALLGRDPAVIRPDKCGSDTGYKYHLQMGERACDSCLDAHARYKAARPRPMPILKHGTRRAHEVYRCQCGPCVQATRDYYRERHWRKVLVAQERRNDDREREYKRAERERRRVSA